MTLRLCWVYSITEQTLLPLKAQLKEYDHALLDQLDLISALKANIIHNSEKIERMLHSVSNSWVSYWRKKVYTVLRNGFRTSHHTVIMYLQHCLASRPPARHHISTTDNHHVLCL